MHDEAPSKDEGPARTSISYRAPPLVTAIIFRTGAARSVTFLGA
ncbi:MAG: hypothetical protein Q8P67_08405 [archaeon]|nr:hypothetical protein [archaeon]